MQKHAFMDHKGSTFTFIANISDDSMHLPKLGLPFPWEIPVTSGSKGHDLDGIWDLATLWAVAEHCPQFPCPALSSPMPALSQRHSVYALASLTHMQTVPKLVLNRRPVLEYASSTWVSWCLSARIGGCARILQQEMCMGYLWDHWPSSQVRRGKQSGIKPITTSALLGCFCCGGQ